LEPAVVGLVEEGGVEVKPQQQQPRHLDAEVAQRVEAAVPEQACQRGRGRVRTIGRRAHAKEDGARSRYIWTSRSAPASQWYRTRTAARPRSPIRRRSSGRRARPIRASAMACG